jgi:phosphoglycerate kinase
MKCIDELSANELKGKRVLVRAGLDVPLEKNGEVSDMFRVKEACPTLSFLSERGARVIILSHRGRDPKETNAPVARALSSLLKVFYIHDLLGPLAHDAVRAMKEGEVLMLENLRQDPREIAGDDSLAKELAQFGDIYVNDAFSNSHRSHASMVGLPKLLPSYAGLIVRDEVAHLAPALRPPHPSLAIIGGAKFETKEPIIRTFLETYDHVCVVGALANDILKKKGFPVGHSLISEYTPSPEVCAHARLIVPIDVTVERADKQARVKKPQDVGPDDRIVDIGPDTVAALAPHIAEAKFVTWNGPTGIFEEGFNAYTHSIAELISKSNAQKVIGGGDTVAAIEQSGVLRENLGFLSTGGGAMLEYLLKGTLPAIEVLG